MENPYLLWPKDDMDFWKIKKSENTGKVVK